MNDDLLAASCRVALAALLHDLGKFHERSGLPVQGDAAAAHHKPATFLQWIVATADRAASGFERQKFDAYNADAEGETFTRKNRYQARLADPERPDWDEPKLLLIQGDFFGIQDFIFANGGATQKHAHKLLRGRSFQVSLLAELAALKLLEALQLPSTSQIINAAGKFLIVAPNTESARAAVKQCGYEFDAWCLKHTFGEIGVGLASTEASCNDLVGGQFKTLIDKLFAALDVAKHRRFDLCGAAPAVMATDFPHGPCEYHGRYPAGQPREGDDKPASCALSRDQRAIGDALTKRARLLVIRNASTFGKPLELDYFGYRIAFVADEDISGKYGDLARDGTLVRAWDFDLPEADGTVFRGYARRYVNSFVPRQTDGALKTLEDIAAAGTGEIALVTLKGDIDDLGALFQKGLETPTFARWASLSRQVNAFFALWLPWHCAQHAPDTYTVFAGGDDFFLIGPWEQTIALAGQMREAFGKYVARDDITFSLGATMSHPNTPARHLAEAAEAGLEQAKAYRDQDGKAKNAASLWGVTVGREGWRDLTGKHVEALDRLIEGQSTGFLYSLLRLADQAESKRPEDALWRSRLHYRSARLIKDKATRQALISEVGGALEQHRGGYRIPVSLLLYRKRK